MLKAILRPKLWPFSWKERPMSFKSHNLGLTIFIQHKRSKIYQAEQAKPLVGLSLSKFLTEIWMKIRLLPFLATAISVRFV